ncbi:transcription elongation factor A protein 3 [Oryzias melastigma]|uniref:transcription elongation factor A protein 3 n=1 Tax=Oryzias melastigma TaxID=30732 RepID=UPI000CF832ED|nr:transcription elongation factor A protein 3 [Oryzias melastigma]
MTPEEDLVRIAKKLDKMVSRNNTDGALDLLKELKNIKMTLKLLQETRIGMSVNSIRKHCTDEEAISLAKLLIKDWKRLLDSGRTQSGKATEVENGVDSSKKSSGSNSLSPEKQGRWLEVKMKSDPDTKPSDKNGEEKQKDRHTHRREPEDKKEENEKHLQESREKKLKVVRGDERPDQRTQKHNRAKEEDSKRMRHVEELKREKQTEEMKRTADEVRKESRLVLTPDRPPLKPHKPADKPLFERRGVLDSSVLYPTGRPSPPRPARPPNPKRPAVDVKKDRKDDSASRTPRPPQPTSPPAKKPAAEVKKERKIPPDPNAPIAPLPLHLHPPPQRKEPPDPNAPLPPLPLHLHPPPLALKHPSVDGKKEKDRRKVSTDSKPPQQKHEKRERKDSVDGKISKKLSGDAKKERKDSSDSKAHLPKESCVEVKKDKHRKDSCDSKPGQLARSHSTDSKLERQESTDSKRSISPPAKKLSAERRESHGSKPSQPGPAQRKPSTDSMERKAKTEAPRTPTTPTSPMSPSFSSPGGPLPPHLATGDSVRDKCIEMLAAALRTDNDHKDFGVNCDSMAAEIEDHIYQETRATDMKYKNRVRSRISNLKDPKNPGLRRNVLAGSIELSRIASMSAEEMASDELKQLRNVLTQEAIREHQMAKTGGTTTDLLQCGKCKKKNCTYNQVQTRSADEPMTTFVLCNECGNRWKFC